MTAIASPDIRLNDQQAVEQPAVTHGRTESLQRAGGWLSVFLLIMMLLAVAWSVNAAGWTGGLHVLQWMVVGGAVLGFALSQSRWHGIWPVVHSLVCSVTWLTIWIATLVPGDFGARERVYQLFAAIALWVERAIGGQASAGSVIFVLLLSIVSWWVAYGAAWALFRRYRVWQAIIPAGLFMLLNLYYAPSRLSLYFVLFTFCALMLAVRSNLTQREAGWRAANVRYAMDIGLDFLRDGVLFAALVLALAYFLPTAASQGRLESLVRPLERPWERLRQEWTRLFTSLTYPVQQGYNAFGKSLALSGPVSLTDAVIMDVRAPAGRYWRATVYHTYTGRGWLNDDQESVGFGQGGTSRLPRFDLTRPITQSVTTYYPGNGILFYAGQPQRVDVAAMAESTYLPEEVVPAPTPMPGGAQRLRISPPLDISTLYSRDRLKEGDGYTVLSAITKADIESLREAGDGYPGWIRDRYLQLPDDLPQRIRDLAFEITSPYDNLYDKTSALERYLRQQYAYNDKIAPPPPEQDGVDYFLFGVQEGYCDYYASAMAVMARAVGIPARVAAGYSQGEFDQEREVYRIRELNAHAWVEVFFPTYGWVEFEPTANEPVIVRPVAPPAGSAEDLNQPLDDEGEEEDKFGDEPLFGQGTMGGMQPLGGGWPLSLPWTIGLGAGLLLLVGGGVVWLLLRRLPSAVPTLLGQLYEKLVFWGQRLKLHWRPHQTVYEQATLMTEALPEGQPYISSIASLYVREQFSPAPASQEDLQSAARSWLALRPLLWRRWIKRLTRPEGLLRWRDHWSKRLASQFPG